MPVLALLCAVCVAAGVQDPVRVSATLSATRISVGTSTTLQISVETPGESPEEIRLPPLSPDLQTLGSADFTQTHISIPGGRSRVTRRDIILAPGRAGVYRIAPIAVRVRGDTYYTQPLELVVDDSPGATRSAPTALGDQPGLSLWLEPDTVYVGEQVLLQAQAVFPDEMRLRQTRPASFDPPAPSGFWVQDLPNPVMVSLRVLDGRTVEQQTFRRAYFPLSAGRFVFPPAKLHYELRRGFLYAPESRQIESRSAPLIVQPLPEVGRPASFSGAVGSFSMRAALSPQRVHLGDATTLVLELVGTGNVKALPEPKLPQLDGVEIYAPAQDSRVEVVNERVGGSKRFRWVLVPERAGQVVIPPIEYSYFDPAERKYQILRTDPLTLDAVPIVVAAGRDTALRPLHERARNAPLDWVGSRGFVALQTVPLLALLLLVTTQRRRARGPTPREIRARVLADIEALRARPADAAFLSDLQHALERGVRTLLGREGDPSAELRAAGANAAAKRLDTVLLEIRRLRYAPSARFDRDALLHDALAVIDMIPLGRRTRPRTTAVLLALLLPAAALVGGARAQSSRWDTAVATFRAGDYVSAARQFHEYARTQPRSADAWYNHGLAAHRAGDPGRAVWAWLRAARLAPRDGDVAHNLEVAGARLALDVIRPFDRLATNERWLLAGIAWWLLAAGIGLALTRRRGALPLLGTAAVITLIVVVGSAASAARPLRVTPLGQGTELLAAPHVHAESLGRFEVGSLARVRDRRPGYLLIQVDEVRAAWVERSAVAAP